MQEEALLFNKIYGFQVILIPVRADRTSGKTEDSIEIGTDRRAPAPWRSMPREQEQTDSAAPRTQINPGIERQIERISEENFGDMFLSDSQQHIDKIRNTALSTNEYPICYLTLTMLVPKGNPHHFRSVKDVLDTNRRLGIMEPSFDGLGESSWQVLSKIVPGGESAIPRELVQLYERQYDLLEALELGNIDAALVWNATSQVNFLLAKYADEYNAAYEKEMRAAERKKDKEGLRHILQEIYKHIVDTQSFAEEVLLTENPDERCVIAVRLVALSSAFKYGHCERFADFMRSNQGKEILRRFGFVTE
jgi:ABC-type molybdate transport system substrate-binding protein